MAAFPSLVLTNAGVALQNKVQGGTTLKFTNIQMGSGQLNGQPIGPMTALISPNATVPIQGGQVIGQNTYQVEGFFTNANLSAGFWWREIGIFANDPDSGEILYAYANAGDAGDYIPTVTDQRIEKYIYFSMALANATTVTVTIPQTDTYVLKSEVNQPGGVAGLNASGKLEEAIIPSLPYDQSGSAAVVQANLTAHTADKNNPHSVTAAQAGAIPASQLGQPGGVAQLGEDGKVPADQLGAAGGSLLTVTFDASFAGLPYTIAGGEESYAGTVPESLEAVHSLLGIDTAYTLTVQGSDKNYTRTVTTLDYFTALEVSIAPFSATITVTCPAGSIVTCANGDTTLTQTATSGTAAFTVGNTGTWTITATLDGQTATDTVQITSDGQSASVTLSYVHIYGVLWDGTSTTALSRTDDAADFVDPTPSVGGSGGSSPFDGLMPWAGMERVTDPEAGELVKIPKFWYKWTKSGNSLKLQIADGPVDGFFVSPAHCDRGDGAGERDVVYVGRYHCVSTYKSQKSDPRKNITRSAARSGIKTLGSDIWQWDWAMNWTIKMLYLVEFADWNSQTKIGYGCGSNSNSQFCGYTDSMPYHTGTTQSSRTTYGLGTQYRYIEGLWDNVYDWVDGCYYNGNGLNIILNPNNFSDTSGGTLVGKPSSGYPSALTVDDALNNQWVYPTTAGGSDSTYVPDSWYFDASDPCLRVGGSYNQSLNRGLFYVSYNAASNSSANIGSRLMKLP